MNKLVFDSCAKAVSHEFIQGTSDVTSLQIEGLSKPYNS